MKILYIVPGFDEGGVEVHVLNLIREMSSMGHEITLVNSGGKLERELPENVNIIHLPVYRKNLFTIIYCAYKLAGLNKNFHWEIIHAHSRVPAWVAWILSRLINTKWLMTAHALYSLNPGLIALRHADGVICISKAVKNHLKNYLPDENIIIYNGIIPPKLRHNDAPLRQSELLAPQSTEKLSSAHIKFLTVGRLTRLKGIDVVLHALSGLKNYDWSLDVIGEGSQHNELENLAANLELNKRVKFHGAKEKSEIEIFMSNSSCLLFPSHSEGMGLVVLEALAEGLPVIASDIEALHEIACENNSGLVPDGDISAWREALRNFILAGISSKFNSAKIITVHDMALKIEDYYKKFLHA